MVDDCWNPFPVLLCAFAKFPSRASLCRALIDDERFLRTVPSTVRTYSQHSYFAETRMKVDYTRLSQSVEGYRGWFLQGAHQP